MLYLYYHTSSGYSVPRTPSVGNHYELVETDDVDAYDWDVKEQTASNNSDEDDTDWADFVEKHGGRSGWVEYDPTNMIHIQHKSNRPEHAAWKKAQEEKHLADTKARLDAEISEAQALLKKLVGQREELDG